MLLRTPHSHSPVVTSSMLQRIARAHGSAAAFPDRPGFDCVSVLANHARLGPLRAGLCWDAAAGAFAADPLLRTLEPPVAGMCSVRHVVAQMVVVGQMVEDLRGSGFLRLPCCSCNHTLLLAVPCFCSRSGLNCCT